MPDARRAAPSTQNGLTDGDAFDLGAYLPFQIAAAAERVNRAFTADVAARHQLSMGEWRVLAVAAQHDGISATGLARVAMLDKVRVSRAVAALAARGLLKQVANDTDKRARDLRLTRKGRATLGRVLPDVREFEKSLSAALTRPEASTMRGALDKLMPE